MNQNQKIALGGAAGAVLLLYLTGLLWPLVRLALTSVAIVGLAATAYFGFRYFHQKNQTGENLDTNRPHPANAIASAVATVITFLLLSFVPTNDSAPATEAVEESAPIVIKRSVPESQLSDTTPRSTVAIKTPEIKTMTKPMVSAPPQKSVTAKVGTKTRSPQPRARSAASNRSQTTKTKPKMSAAEADRAAAEFMGALLGAAMEQERREQSDPRYQRFKQSLERARVCPRCNGAGSYRYVDGKGVLQVRSCPSCTIPGRSF